MRRGRHGRHGEALVAVSPSARLSARSSHPQQAPADLSVTNGRWALHALALLGLAFFSASLRFTPSRHPHHAASRVLPPAPSLFRPSFPPFVPAVLGAAAHHSILRTLVGSGSSYSLHPIHRSLLRRYVLLLLNASHLTQPSMRSPSLFLSSLDRSSHASVLHHSYSPILGTRPRHRPTISLRKHSNLAVQTHYTLSLYLASFRLEDTPRHSATSVANAPVPLNETRLETWLCLKTLNHNPDSGISDPPTRYV
ncbi:hypothetical protein EIP91_003079 [Steccherinum ochraceum]|uniref:Uncharacterized protein n=1 Tax=Steccherinum ochraceum TaxID=92696 RepID=A0A4R0RH88_9APHY|nr:hypothetical protein EIP91_003079 [Steccherinum ochraceum]